jgi:hypothetical protein
LGRRPGSFGNSGSFGKQGGAGRSNSRGVAPFGRNGDEKSVENREPSLKEMVKKNEDSVKAVETELKSVKDALGEILEFVKKPKSVGFVDDEEVDEDDEVVKVEKVLFLEDTSKIDKMTVDTACPQSMLVVIL